LDLLINEIIKYNISDICEICISDNCSEDKTNEYIHYLSSKYPFIRVKRNEVNLGFAINILNVATMAKGDFIWFFSDDDLIIEGSLKKVIDLLSKELEKVCAVYVNWIYFTNCNGTNSVIENMGTGFRQNDINICEVNRNELLEMTNHKCTFMSSNIVKKEIFIKNLSNDLVGRSTFPHFEYMMRSLTNNDRILLVSEPLIMARAFNQYYDVNNTIWSGISKMLQEFRLAGFSGSAIKKAKRHTAKEIAISAILAKSKSLMEAKSKILILEAFYYDCKVELYLCKLAYILPVKILNNIVYLCKKIKKFFNAFM
jgi:glycosyltransferase involved in cell wall biosynthesis